MDSDRSYSARLLEAGPPRGKARFAGILLHGRDSTPQEIIGAANDATQSNAIRWVVPEAENSTWYPNRFSDPLAVNEPFLTQAMVQCDAALWDASEAGRLNPQRLVILGFSQGACVALEYAVRRPGSCRAVISFTGALLGTPAEIKERAAKLGRPLGGLHIFLTGSDQDEWIAEESTRESAQALLALGAQVTLRIYPGRSHIVSPEEFADARKFLRQHAMRRDR